MHSSLSSFQQWLPNRWALRTKTGWLLAGWASLLALNRMGEQSVRQYPFLKARQAKVSSAERRLQASWTELLPSVVVQNLYDNATSTSVNDSFFPNEGTAISTSGSARRRFAGQFQELHQRRDRVAGHNVWAGER